MCKFRKTRDGNEDEKAKHPQTKDPMLIARDRAAKATIRANEILAKASSDGLLNEFAGIKRRMQVLPRSEELPRREEMARLAIERGFALFCLIITITGLILLSRYIH